MSSSCSFVLPHTTPKADRMLTPVCEVWSHSAWLGAKLMMIDGYGMQMSSVGRSAVEMQAKVDEWKAAMLETGWS